MKISYNWLQDYLPVDVELSDLVEVLTNTGLEVSSVEKIEKFKGSLEGLIVGEVLSVANHPNADRLKLTRVAVGNGQERFIICGAPNIAAGQKVVVALPGTTIFNVDGEAMEIKKGKIRGEESDGMICAEDEIGIGKDHSGVLVLPEDARVGSPVGKYFHADSDYCLEVDLTPNRTDAMSFFGVARDYLAFVNMKGDKSDVLQLPDVSSFKNDNNDLKITVEIKDTEACPRYSGLSMRNLKVGPSPEWLQERLKTVGLKPINNIVDLANYVMYETGQPLHVFDADEIKGNKVIVGTWPEGKEFTSLDKVKRKLDAGDLMINNEKEPMCIAGVFGGLDSGVTNSTKNIFIESAFFTSSGIRKTARRHGLNTDASYRYERGANAGITVYALKRLALLIRELVGGEISSEIVDVYPRKIEVREVELRKNYLNRVAGKVLPVKIVTNILNSLGIELTGETDDKYNLLIPLYRTEVTREIDAVEEIMRIYGYNSIDLPDRMHTSVSSAAMPDRTVERKKALNFLSDRAFREVVNNSLIAEKNVVGEGIVKILNPLSSDLNVLRNSMLTGGLQTIEFNRNRNEKDLKLFEYGKTYHLEGEDKFREREHLAVWMTGNDRPEHWRSEERGVNFYDLKEIVESLFGRMGIDSAKIKTSDYSGKELEYGLSYFNDAEPLVSFGLVHRDWRQRFDISEDVYYADINWEAVTDMTAYREVKFRELPKFPSIRRDLALLIDESVSYAEVEQIALETEKNILRNVNLFDVYRGKGIGKGKKSYAVSFVFRDDAKTLTDKHIDQVMNKMVKNLRAKIGAEPR